MLNVSSVLISLAPLWAILLVASSAAAYFVFWRNLAKRFPDSALNFIALNRPRNTLFAYDHAQAIKSPSVLLCKKQQRSRANSSFVVVKHCIEFIGMCQSMT